jgi:hypothetical protein
VIAAMVFTIGPDQQFFVSQCIIGKQATIKAPAPIISSCATDKISSPRDRKPAKARCDILKIYDYHLGFVRGYRVHDSVFHPLDRNIKLWLGHAWVGCSLATAGAVTEKSTRRQLAAAAGGNRTGTTTRPLAANTLNRRAM